MPSGRNPGGWVYGYAKAWRHGATTCVGVYVGLARWLFRFLLFSVPVFALGRELVVRRARARQFYKRQPTRTNSNSSARGNRPATATGVARIALGESVSAMESNSDPDMSVQQGSAAEPSLAMPPPATAKPPPDPPKAKAMPPKTQKKRSADNVRVAVRVRPLLPSEKLKDSASCVKFEGKRQVSLGNRRFAFDAVFAPETTQEDVYSASVASLVEALFEGYNATVLAYGQTGAGKTHTMGSGNCRNVEDERIGIIPRSARDIFRLAAESAQAREVDIKVSFIEVYNESIRDLLHPAARGRPPIQIREAPGSRIQLVGVREERVRNYHEMMRYLERGSVSRTTGSTLMNQQSSRSHAIFTVNITQRGQKEEEKAGPRRQVQKSKFHLVDLAGSERAKRTGAVGLRFKESVTINKGLLALGNVISALCAAGSGRRHIPYRDSKLTRLLQDSLGGNSRTLMIACVSPADVNFEETLTTLKYADRAKRIRNRAVINREEEKMQSDMRVMREEIDKLTSQLAKLQPGKVAQGLETEMRELKSALGARERELAALSAQKEWLLRGVSSLADNFALRNVLEKQRDATKKEILTLRADYDKKVKAGDCPPEQIAQLVKTIKDKQSGYLSLRSRAAKVQTRIEETAAEYRKAPETLAKRRWAGRDGEGKSSGGSSGGPANDPVGEPTDDPTGDGPPARSEQEGKGEDTARPATAEASPGDLALEGDDRTKGGDGSIVEVVEAMQKALEEESKKRRETEEALALARQDLERDDQLLEALRQREAEAKREVRELQAAVQDLKERISASRDVQQRQSGGSVSPRPGSLDDAPRSPESKKRPPKTSTQSDDDVMASSAWATARHSGGGLLDRLEERDLVLQPEDAVDSPAPPSRVQSARGPTARRPAVPRLFAAAADVARSVMTGGEARRQKDDELRSARANKERQRSALTVEYARLERELEQLRVVTAREATKHAREGKQAARDLRDIAINVAMKAEAVARLRRSGSDDGGEELRAAEAALSEMQGRERESKARAARQLTRHDAARTQRTQELERLEREMKMQRRLLSRLNAKNKAPTTKAAVAEKGPTRPRTPKMGTDAVDTRARGLVGAARPRTAPSQKPQADAQQWLDDEIGAFLSRKLADDKLREELRSRDRALRERSACDRHRETIEAASVRRSQVVLSSILNLKAKLRALDQTLEAKRTEMVRASQAPGAEGGGAPGVRALSDEIGALGRERAGLLQQQAELERKMSGLVDMPAGDRARLEEVRERVESLEALIEYKNGRIREMRARAAGADREQFLANLTQIVSEEQSGAGGGPARAKQIARRFCEMAVELREAKEQAAREKERANLKLQEKDRKIEDLGRNLESAAADYEDRIHRLQVALSEQAVVETGNLEQLIQHKQTRISTLEKEMKCYQKSNEALVARLKVISSGNTGIEGAGRGQELQRENEALKQEVGALKKYVKQVQEYISAKRRAKKNQGGEDVQPATSGRGVD